MCRLLLGSLTSLEKNCCFLFLCCRLAVLISCACVENVEMAAEKPFDLVLSGEPMICANGAFRSVSWNVDGNYCLTSASDKAVVSEEKCLVLL